MMSDRFIDKEQLDILCYNFIDAISHIKNSDGTYYSSGETVLPHVRMKTIRKIVREVLTIVSGTKVAEL